jgi:proton glutamate symport protein
MYYAPIGIGAAIGVAVGSSGLGVLWTLAYMVGTLYVALLLFVGLVLVPVLLVWRIPLRPFAREIRTPFLIAFTTASSEAALPLAMERLERLGVPKRIVAFVMPTGYSFNLDGSTLYLAIASIFAAQAGGIELSLPQQLLIMGTLLLTSKGVAAVPRASLVILTATLTSFKLPLEAIVLIMGVDAFMDMARTSVNLTGNCVASCVIARWEGDVEPGSALDLTAAAAPPPPAPASPPAQAG